MNNSQKIIGPHGGYRNLRSFQTAQAVYDATVIFSDRFIERTSRTRDQMIQAARSGVQNIAEGNMASATSKKTELKLTGVARASLEELLLDYEDFLRQRGLRLWAKESPEAMAVRNLYRSDQSDRSDGSDRSERSDMKLQFEANQQFQLDAINAAVEIFASQPAGASGFSYAKATGIGGTFLSVVANNLILDEETVLKNLQSVQQKNGIEQSGNLDGFHFSIEMETGTRKTYVYLRTIHELHRQYGFKKFIVVVPSLAIKEGVLKNLEITKEHFDILYEKPVMNWFEFDPKKRSLSKNFATTNSLQIMVMNIDQFARAGNIFYQQGDWGVPAEYIKATSPIVIVDEPQNMETDIRRQAIAQIQGPCQMESRAGS